jgi:hypothetical protein
MFLLSLLDYLTKVIYVYLLMQVLCFNAHNTTVVRVSSSFTRRTVLVHIPFQYNTDKMAWRFLSAIFVGSFSCVLPQGLHISVEVIGNCTLTIHIVRKNPPPEAHETSVRTRISGRDLDLLLVSIYKPCHHPMFSEIRFSALDRAIRQSR